MSPSLRSFFLSYFSLVYDQSVISISNTFTGFCLMSVNMTNGFNNFRVPKYVLELEAKKKVLSRNTFLFSHVVLVFIIRSFDFLAIYFLISLLFRYCFYTFTKNNIFFLFFFASHTLILWYFIFISFLTFSFSFCIFCL